MLRDLLWVAVLLYLDNSLIHAKTEKELLDALENFVTRLEEHNIKLHPAKFVLFARALTWCGKQVSETGVKPAPHRADAVREMGDPDTLADMMSFVYGTAWFRNHIIHFAKIAAPLYDMWKDALAPYKRKTKTMAKRFKLADMPAWEEKGKAAFEAVKKGLIEAIETSYFDPKLKTCVFGDASDEFWCLVVTQCEPGVERLPWAEQEGKHRVLVIESGRFRNAQLRWAIVDKEGYVFGEKVMKYSHWINGGELKSAFFTDHHNLLCFFDDEVRPAHCTKPNHQRLTHWGLNIRSLRYEIFLISGEINYIADIGLRWGNKFAGDKVEFAASVGPRVVTKAFMRKDKDVKARSKCVLRLPQPKVHPDFAKPDIDARKDLMLNMTTLAVNLKFIREQQDKYRRSRPKGLKVGQGKVWRDAEGRVWVPKRAKMLKNVLYAVAHQGPHLHRGYDVTLSLLQPHFMWDNIEADVKARHVQCLLCVKAAGGDKVPRPMGTQLIAEYPGEVLMMDYILVWPSEFGRRYVLMLQDKMSKLTQFVVTPETTAVPACRGVIDWSSKFGLLEWIISDGGTHAFHEPRDEACRRNDGHPTPRHVGSLPVGKWLNRGRGSVVVALNTEAKRNWASRSGKT